jgi:hypothetical protein
MDTFMALSESLGLLLGVQSFIAAGCLKAVH